MEIPPAADMARRRGDPPLLLFVYTCAENVNKANFKP